MEADQEFTNESNNQNDDPVMGKISSNLIRAERFGEQTGILSTEKFSGFGKTHNDPAYRLKLLAKKHYDVNDTMGFLSITITNWTPSQIERC